MLSLTNPLLVCAVPCTMRLASEGWKFISVDVWKKRAVSRGFRHYRFNFLCFPFYTKTSSQKMWQKAVMYFTLVGGYIPIVSLVLVHSSLYTQRSSSHWAHCLKAQTLLLNLDIMVSMPWKFMLVDIFHVPSSLCCKQGGGLARGYRHAVERDCRGASVKGRSWSRLRRKMCPSIKTKADMYCRFSVQICRGQEDPSRRWSPKLTV